MNWNLATMVGLAVLGILDLLICVLYFRERQKIRQFGDRQRVLFKTAIDLHLQNQLLGQTISEIRKRVPKEEDEVKKDPEKIRVTQLEKQMACLREGHLDPVCPRCNEPVVLANIAMAPVKPRKTRAIRETKPALPLAEGQSA